jgi:23S rRNA (adenine2030-N6)-methyltransferase
MLSYRHGFHAGNAADVIKHFILLYVLDYLKKKDKNFIFIDAHAGAGKYLISDPYMEKNKEYLSGISKIFKLKSTDFFLKNYLDLIKILNPNSEIEICPGSNWLASQTLRENDRLHFFELHSNEFLNLKNNFENDSRITIEKEDSYKKLIKIIPPKEKRAVILIDPSYELKDEYDKVTKLVTSCYKKFPLGIYIIWYPVLKNKKSEGFVKNFLELSFKNLTHIEMITDKKTEGMQGSGLFIINTPFSIVKDITPSLDKLFHNLKKSEFEGELKFDNWVQ